MSQENKENKFKRPVPWYIFAWTIGVIFMAILALTNSQSSQAGKLDAHVIKNQDIKTDIGIIKTDIKWIKELLEKKN